MVTKRIDQSPQMDITMLLRQHKPELSKFEEIYKSLHKNPGLSLQEHFAASTAENYLRSLPSFDVRTKIGGTGLIGILRNGPGKTVLLRADIDALPVEEQTGLAYASKVREVDVQDGVEKPVMHACGHDTHIACMLAAAHTLHSSQKYWSGTVIILFQPNEERAGGAKAMVADGLYDEQKHACPLPDVVLGQHVSFFAAGTVGTRAGQFMSAADSFKVTVYGRGGHASAPHTTVDPVVMAAQIIVRLQTVVSREVDPQEAAVVTVGSIQGGTTENVIPAEAVMKINTRSFTAETRKRVLTAIRRIVKAECEASGAPKEAKWEDISSFPLTINDEETTAHICKAFSKQFGDMFNPEFPILGGSEDFSILATEAPNKHGGKGVPYCFWTFGGTDPKKWKEAEDKGDLDDIPKNHSAYFGPVIEPTLSTGIDALLVAALSFLTPTQTTMS